jgi:hypothetical protein
MSEEEKEQADVVKEGSGVVPAPISFAEFLESSPPSGHPVLVDGLFHRRALPGGSTYYELDVPQLQLHCTSDDCNGLRFFRYNDGDRVLGKDGTKTFLTFVCSNCRKRAKIYALSVQVKDAKSGTGWCTKFGEVPSYGPPTPARLIRLFGRDRELFLKGRRCENQGLGIGAFVYYRRVVENHRDTILSEIIRVAEKIRAPAAMIETLNNARKETQFSKALASVKDAIPVSLLVNGHNPLTLLHSALSGGVHEHSDERCLELAHDVRVVLVELAERLGEALKNEAELNSAVGRLLNVREEK